MGGHRQRVAGVVIQPGQDLGVGAVGQPVMGEVRLPALVGQVRGEPEVGRPGPFLRRRDDQPGPGQVAGDRRRRHGDGVVVGQVPARSCPGRRPARPRSAPCGSGRSAPPWPPGSPSVSGSAAATAARTRPPLAAVTSNKFVHPRPRHAIRRGDLGRPATLHDNGGKNQTRFRHRRSVEPYRPLCLERPVRDVLMDGTFGSATSLQVKGLTRDFRLSPDEV